MAKNILVAMVVLYLLMHTPVGSAAPACEFVDRRLTYVGDATSQAECLLREVGRHGIVAHDRRDLPSALAALVGRSVGIDANRLNAFLKFEGILATDVGGSTSHSVSRAMSNSPGAPPAGYFVIHDTSSPNYGDSEFPADIDSPEWTFNSLERWNRGSASSAHVFIGRSGNSITAIDFSRSWRATKFERGRNGRLKGLFIHVELVQPRRSSLAKPKSNDAIAPDPGFTTAQYRRLALVYVAASVRRGTWLVPAFHAVLDADIEGGHDDPQRFDLAEWADELARLRQQITSLELRPAEHTSNAESEPGGSN